MKASKRRERPPERPPKLTDAERHKRFVETAKKVEASEDLEDFDVAFRNLAVKTQAKQEGPKR